MCAYAQMSACILDVFARLCTWSHAFVYICVCIHVGYVCMCLGVCVWTRIYVYLCVCMYMVGGSGDCRCLSMQTACGCMLDEARKGSAHDEITRLGLRPQAHWQGGGPGRVGLKGQAGRSDWEIRLRDYTRRSTWEFTLRYQTGGQIKVPDWEITPGDQTGSSH